MERSPVNRQSIESFYHLRNVQLDGCHCQGLACFAGRAANPAYWSAALSEPERIYCLGKCYQGPSSTDSDTPPHIESIAGTSVLLGNLLEGGVHSLSEYLSRGGGEALSKSLAQGSAAIIATVLESGLRGRGGAGFPVGRKWQAVAGSAHLVKYIVINADEGDPGSFSDRFLMEDDPFLLIEAAVIAGFAVGARSGIIYLRKEYPLAHQRLLAAMEAARSHGLLGMNIFQSDFSFDLEIVLGEGSYLCGEETAMLNAIEGKRAEVRSRPPFIYDQGLFSAPTLVNNVETLCAVPWIIRNGARAYFDLGFSNSRGTKLLSLNSLFNRPGLYEIEFGITLKEIVEDLGGGLRSGSLRALMVGGPLAGLIPPALFDTRFGYEEMQSIGATIGHGGVIVFADNSSIAEIAREVFRFGSSESCGKCTPCHFGTPQLEENFAAVAAQQAPTLTRQDYDDIIFSLGETASCGHGRGLADFARSIDRHFHKELESCLA